MVDLVAVFVYCLMAFVTALLTVCFALLMACSVDRLAALAVAAEVYLLPANCWPVSMLCIDLCSQMEVCNCLILQDLLKILVLPVLTPLLLLLNGFQYVYNVKKCHMKFVQNVEICGRYNFNI